MRKLSFLFVLFTSLGLFAQNNGSVKGSVTDLEANGEPMLFADVSLKDTNLKTRTNFNGNFEITDVAPGKYILQISFLGYETVNMPVEINENKVSEVHSGLSAKTIALDPILLSSLETDKGEVQASLVRNMEE